MRSDFEDIHRSITKLQVEEKVPVPGYLGVVVDYQLLRALEEKGRKEHSPSGSKRGADRPQGRRFTERR